MIPVNKGPVMSAVIKGLIECKAGAAADLSRNAEDGLYAVIDACDELAVCAKATELGSERAVSLYRGDPEEVYWDIAPYLFRVDADLIRWVLEEFKDKPWGFFAVARASLEEMRRHFRRFLLVKSPQGDGWYFRFYDPRVLQAFLASCREDELGAFFGPIQAFVVTDPAVPGLTFLAPRAPFGAGPYHLATAAASKQQLLAIRQEHMAGFQSLVEKIFEKRVAAHLRNEHADLIEELSDDMLLQRVRAGLARARRHGIDWESAQVTFVVWMFAFAPNFDEYPKFQAILRDPSVAPNRRIDRILDESTEEDWDEVERRSSARTWHV
jgi:hypothetical protein